MPATATKKEKRIEIKDIGPIEKLSLPVPTEGGLVVLRAKNGKGKTKALEAAETVLTGRGKLEVRDKALRGEVEAFGVHITVAKSARRSGELEVTSLEGKLSVAELVDPGLKQPEAADAKRIKALITLSGVKPQDLAAQFRELLGGRSEFETVVRPESLAGDDAVAAADRVKRDIETAARKEEDQAQHAQGRAESNTQAAGSVDLTTETDAELLQRELEEAVRREAGLKAGRDATAAAATAQRETQQALETDKAKYSGPSVEDAKAEERKRLETFHNANAELEEANRQYEMLIKKLSALEASKNLLSSEYVMASKAREAAEQHERTLSRWQEQIDKPLPACASDEEMAAAVEQVKACRVAIEQAALVRKAQLHLFQADTAKEEAQEHDRRGTQLREAAKGVDEVLSSAVAKLSGKLRVEAGRLVLDTARGATYFSDLSHGERWKIALDIAIDALGDGAERGVIVIPQDAFEGLDPENRKLVADHLRARQVVGLTAEATDDETIHAEVL